MNSARLIACTFGLIALATTTALAQPAPPPAPPAPPTSPSAPAASPPAPKLGAIEIEQGAPELATVAQSREPALVACVPPGRALVRTRIAMRWDDTGRLTMVAAIGGTTAYNHCVRSLLRRGTVAATRRGSGQLTLIVRAPASAPGAPPPRPIPHPPHPELVRCKVDRDCRLHYQLSACVAQDPVAVNKANPRAVMAAFPVRRLECAMGGPQWERLQSEAASRYGVICMQRQCTLVDHGERTAGVEDLGL